MKGRDLSSFQYKGEIDESKPITLEIKGEIKDGTEGSTATAVKKIYNVTYENYYTASIPRSAVSCVSPVTMLRNPV